jgi:hypothetical protein
MLRRQQNAMAATLGRIPMPQPLNGPIVMFLVCLLNLIGI